DVGSRLAPGGAMLRRLRRLETWIAAAVVLTAAPGAPGAADALYEPRSHAAAVAVTVDPSGGLHLTRGANTFTIRSYFSRPDGGWLYLGAAPDGAGNETWKVAVLAGTNSYVVVGNTATYSLSRTITVYSNRVEVRDGITNLSDRMVGVRFGHEVVDGAAAGFVAGNAASGSVTANAPERPFVQVSKGGMSIGLVARDDAFRNQSVTYSDANATTFGIRDDNFG